MGGANAPPTVGPIGVGHSFRADELLVDRLVDQLKDGRHVAAAERFAAFLDDFHCGVRIRDAHLLESRPGAVKQNILRFVGLRLGL